MNPFIGALGRAGRLATKSLEMADRLGRENERLRAGLNSLAQSADTAALLLKKDYPGEAASLDGYVAAAKKLLSSA